MSKFLMLTFLTAENKKVAVSIREPKDDLTREKILPVCEKIISSTIFNTNKRTLKEFSRASYITRTEDVIN